MTTISNISGVGDAWQENTSIDGTLARGWTTVKELYTLKLVYFSQSESRVCQNYADARRQYI